MVKLKKRIAGLEVNRASDPAHHANAPGLVTKDGLFQGNVVLAHDLRNAVQGPGRRADPVIDADGQRPSLGPDPKTGGAARRVRRARSLVARIKIRRRRRLRGTTMQRRLDTKLQIKRRAPLLWRYLILHSFCFQRVHFKFNHKIILFALLY